MSQDQEYLKRLKRPGQRSDESAMEYLRRVVNNLDHEYESKLDCLPSADAVLEYFELQSFVYQTEFWVGILEAVEMGESEKPALEFITKWRLPDSWKEDIQDAIDHREDK